MPEIDSLLKFVKMTHQLQQVKRALYVPGEKRLENDLEHHYQLAIVAWYIVESQALNLDKNKVLQYAMIHDLVEVYAGDTDSFLGNQFDKKVREKKAAERLQLEFPDFKNLHHLIEQYEARVDAESKFVYALDKIIPTINNYLDGGRTWKERGITFQHVKENKRGKISQHPHVEKLFAELVEKIAEKEKELFPAAEAKLKLLDAE